MFFPTIKSGDLFHLIIRQFKPKQIQVLFDMFRISGTDRE